MAWSHRFIAALGIAAAAVLSAFTLSAGVGRATDLVAFDPSEYYTCDGNVCLVMGDAAWSDWTYTGVRPFITDWHGDAQPYNVVVDAADGASVTVGSYNITIEDFWSPVFSVYQYHYGDFMPTGGAAGFDLGWMDDLSGATVYNVTLGDFHSLMLENVGPHDASYYVTTIGDFTNTIVVAGGASADFVQSGDGPQMFLWNSLFHGDILEAQVPDYVLPADPFSGLDFDPSQYFGGDLIDGI